MATEAGSKIHDTLNAPNDAAAKAAISPHVPPPKQGMSDPRYGVEQCCVREFWAVVERDASLVRGRNVLRTRKLGVGIYEVFFTGDVSNGAFVATIGRPGIATEPPARSLWRCAAAQAWVSSNPSKATRACGFRHSILPASPATARST